MEHSNFSEHGGESWTRTCVLVCSCSRQNVPTSHSDCFIWIAMLRRSLDFLSGHLLSLCWIQNVTSPWNGPFHSYVGAHGMCFSICSHILRTLKCPLQKEKFQHLCYGLVVTQSELIRKWEVCLHGHGQFTCGKSNYIPNVHLWFTTWTNMVAPWNHSDAAMPYQRTN